MLCCFRGAHCAGPSFLGTGASGGQPRTRMKAHGHERGVDGKQGPSRQPISSRSESHPDVSRGLTSGHRARPSPPAFPAGLPWLGAGVEAAPRPRMRPWSPGDLVGLRSSIPHPLMESPGGGGCGDLEAVIDDAGKQTSGNLGRGADAPPALVHRALEEPFSLFLVSSGGTWITPKSLG